MNNSRVLEEKLAPIAELLARPGVTEVCINRPGEAFIETEKGWERVEIPALSFEWGHDFAQALSSFNNRGVGDEKPLLSAKLPTKERVFVVVPPSCEPGTISITIRKPRTVSFTHDEIAEQGFYNQVKRITSPLTEHDRTLLSEKELRLLELFETSPKSFLEEAVRTKKNGIISGETGSGKTALCQALMRYIPKEERVVLIEDPPEIECRLPNSVRLIYESDGKANGGIGSKELLRGALRMNPDRIFLGELRGPEAYDLLVNVNSGHGGTLTTLHSASTSGAIGMIIQRIRESEEGRSFSSDDLRELIFLTIDFICQIQTSRVSGGKERWVSELYYDPIRKYQFARR